MTIQYLPATAIEFDDFVKTFNLAYQDYFVPIQMEVDSMQRLVKRDAIDLQASQVALNQGEPVGVGMLAVRERQGWIGGLGVIPGYRGQGIGRQLTAGLLQTAQHLGLQQVQLEVIERNHIAHQLYQSLNFRDSRRLLLLEAQPMHFDDEIDETYQIEEVSAMQAISHYQRFHEQHNPWQRRVEALTYLNDSMEAWVAVRKGEVLAYAVGWIVNDVIRWMDIGMKAYQSPALKALLMSIHSLAPTSTGGISNLPETDPTYSVLQALGYYTIESQMEMILELEG